jgi:hypothetical protein
MLVHPIPNRLAKTAVSWYNKFLEDVLPFKKNDKVDLNLSQYRLLGKPSLPTFGNHNHNKWMQDWMPGRIIDIEINKQIFVVIPDVPWKVVWQIASTLTPFYVPFEHVQDILFPQQTKIPKWRNLTWIFENIGHDETSLFQLYFCADMDLSPHKWFPVSLKWYFTDGSGEEHLLIGYDTDFSRDVQWISLLNENIYLGDPYLELLRWDLIAKDSLPDNQPLIKLPTYLSYLPEEEWSSYNNTSFFPLSHRVLFTNITSNNLIGNSSSSFSTTTSTAPPNIVNAVQQTPLLQLDENGGEPNNQEEQHYVVLVGDEEDNEINTGYDDDDDEDDDEDDSSDDDDGSEDEDEVEEEEEKNEENSPPSLTDIERLNEILQEEDDEYL